MVDFKAGDLVVMPPDYDAGGYLTYIGIALGENEAFIDGSIFDNVELKKIKNISLSHQKLQKKLQEEYLNLVEKNLSYDIESIKVGDLFVAYIYEFVYLGEYVSAITGDKYHVYLMLYVNACKDRVDKKQYRASRIFQKKLHTGSLTSNSLFRFLQNYGGLNVVKQPHSIEKVRYIGHVDLPLTSKTIKLIRNKI